MKGRQLLREEAKKVYKEQVKGIPKKQRIPFSDFFKQYKKLKMNKSAGVDEEQAPEDFDFESLVNINEISDDSLVVEEDTEEDK